MGFSKSFKKIAGHVAAPVFSLPAKAIQKVTGMSPQSQLMAGAGVGSALGLYGGIRSRMMSSQYALPPGVAGPQGPRGVMSAQGGGGFNFGSLLPGMIGAGADIYSARQIAGGQQEANEMTLQSARERMAFENQQADEQMAFQREMADTQVQRRMADLKKAGLNPVLAAGEGAAAPVGAAGSGAQGQFGNAAPDYRGVVPKAIGSAVELKRMAKEFEHIDADIGFVDAGRKLREKQVETEAQSARSVAAEADIGEAEAVKARQEASFYKKYPWLLKLKIGTAALSPVLGAARDAGLAFFGVKKGLEGAPSRPGKVLKPSIIRPGRE